MIIKKSHIIKQFIAISTLLIFLLPAVVSFAHTIDDHHHFETCKIVGETHVHESQLDCDWGDLQMVKVAVFAFAKAYEIPHVLAVRETFALQTQAYSQSVSTQASRGPPTFL